MSSTGCEDVDPFRLPQVRAVAEAVYLLLPDEEVATEIKTICPAHSVDAVSMEVEYLKLSDREFELLLYTLFKAEEGGLQSGVCHDRVRLLNKGADRGRDVVLYRDQFPVAVVQCKRYEGAIGLPDVFREIVRFLLSAELHPELLPDPGNFTYVLALASGATENASDFFHEPRRIVKQEQELIRNCVSAAIKKYRSFEGLDVAAACQAVFEMLDKLSFQLLVREDLDLWLKNAKDVFSTFFSARVVVDASAVANRLDLLNSSIQRLAEEGAGTSADFLATWFQHSGVSTMLSVVAPSPGVRGAPPIILDDVYVPRTIESEIDKWIAKGEDPSSEGVLVAIVAPGGFGKTSLLWNCRRKFSHQYNTILCTSTQITSLVQSGTFNQSQAALLKYVQTLRAAGRRSVVCLDTFDALVYREELLAAALRLLGDLLKVGACVVLSSRPEELAKISLEGLANESVRLFLQPYDEEEFSCAIERHCKAFYRGSNLGSPDIEDQADRLRNLVGLGRPLKEVCLNPLTLRMLFELYAPSAIPEDINSFGLYTEYWAAKVLGDKRAGAHVGETPGRNLSAAAMFLASQMLAAGTPSLSKNQLGHHVARGKIDESEVAELLSRNLLIRSDLGGIEFFHQTFFEYSAACHLEGTFSGGISACILELRKFANDGFRLPIFEQLLLLFSESTEVDTTELEAGVDGLLRETHPGLLGVGLHVHMLSQTGLDCGREFTIDAAKRADPAVLKRFCQLIYNLRRNRADEVTQMVEAAWGNSTWKIIELLSQMFIWLAQNSWHLCRVQLEEKDLVSVLYKTAQATAHVERTIISIIRHGLSTDREWALKTALRCGRNHRHAPIALEFVASQVKFMSLDEAAEIAETVIKKVDSAPSKHEGVDLDPPSSCLAAIWDNYPQLCPVNFTDISNLDRAVRMLVLRALARVSNVHMDSVRSKLLAGILDEQLPNELHLLLHEFLAPFLMAHQTRSSHVMNQAVDCCHELLLRVLGTSKSGNAWSNSAVCSQVVSGFVMDIYVQGTCPTLLTQKLLEVSSFRWLEESEIVHMFPIALAENSTHAKDAYDLICESPERYVNHVSVLVGIFPILPCTGDRLSMVIKLSMSMRDTPLTLSYFEQIQESQMWEELEEEIFSQAEMLSIIVRAGLDSPKSRSRSRSYKLLALLVRRGVVAPPSQKNALEWVDGDSQLGCRMAALPLLVEATRPESAYITIEALLRLGETSVSSAINPVLDCMRTVLAQPGVKLSSPMLRQLTEFAVRSDATEPQASIVGRVIDICCAAGDVNVANIAALTLVRSPSVRRFSATQKRTLGHHLDKPFLNLYQRLSAEDVQVHCHEIKGMDPYLGRLLVVALCKSDRPDKYLHLNKIIADDSVHPDLHKIIQDFRRFLWKG